MSDVCVTGPFSLVDLLTLGVVIGVICTVFNRVLTQFLRRPGRGELRDPVSRNRIDGPSTPPKRSHIQKRQVMR